jgi:hypothetical protein
MQSFQRVGVGSDAPGQPKSVVGSNGPARSLDETGGFHMQVQEQRLSALVRANEVRCHRARVKAALARGDADVVPLLAGEDPLLSSMRVGELLMAVPGLGQVRVRDMLMRAHVSASRPLGGLTDRERGELLARLAARR